MALALVVVCAVGPFIQEITAQSGSRFSFLGAVVDDQTLRVDSYGHYLGGDDYVERDGHAYSDKAPGQLVLAVPVYATARAVGAEPAAVARYQGNLGAWWVTLWTSVIPAALLCSLMFIAARRWYPDTAAPAALAVSFGTLLLVFSSQMYSHALSTLLGFAAWMVASRSGPPDRRRLLAVGLLCGAAVAVEYTLAIVAAAVLVWLVRAGVRRGLGWVALGTLPAVLLLAVYHQLSYGSPLRTSYSLKPSLHGATVMGGPDPWMGMQALVGSRGLLLLTPVVLVAVLGCVALVRGGGVLRPLGVLPLGLLAPFVVLQSGWPNPWGGEMPGPRYLIPVLPFLAVPLAHMWRSHRAAALGATLVGAVLMGMGVLTVHLVSHGAGVVRTYIDQVAEGPLVPTTFTVAVGPAGWLLHLVLLAGAVLYLRYARQLDDAARTAEHATADATPSQLA